MSERINEYILVSLLKKLNHSLVPKCHKLFKTSNNMYLIYDKMPGITLAQFVQQGIKGMEWQQYRSTCLKISQQLLQLIVYLVDRKICHSFINLNSVLIHNHSVAKVVNYSHAHQLTSLEGKSETADSSRSID